MMLSGGVSQFKEGLHDGPLRMLREGCSKSGVGLHDGPLRMLKRVIQEST